MSETTRQLPDPGVRQLVPNCRSRGLSPRRGPGGRVGWQSGSTPPEAPVTRTGWPRIAGLSQRMCSAVRPAVEGSVACANSKHQQVVQPARFVAPPPCGAQPSRLRIPTTLASGLGAVLNVTCTRPAKSQPGRQPSATDPSALSSPRLREMAVLDLDQRFAGHRHGLGNIVKHHPGLQRNCQQPVHASAGSSPSHCTSLSGGPPNVRK